MRPTELSTAPHNAPAGRKTKRALLAGAAALALCLGLARPARANEEVYRKTARSTVYIERPDGNYGSGFLVDTTNRYVVTARHVVATRIGTLKTVDVIFAEADKDGEIITEQRYYKDNRTRLTIRATVVYDSAKRDLAILQLEKLPAGAKALPLALRPARPAQEIHVVGNSTKMHGALFRYCAGKVSNVFRWGPPANRINAQVVAHFAPSNKGDSGGPVVNNQGEVVGFISEGTTGLSSSTGPFSQQQLVDHSICVSEVRAALKEHDKNLAKSAGR
jgi:S1-C subfamily serine protease